jgi:PTS system mannose-specific IIA component
MFDVVILSHGGFSKAILESAELIAGEQQRIYTSCLNAGCNLDDFQNEISELFKKVSENGEFLVFTDIMYGTPFNTVICQIDNYRFKHFSGVNLPILLEVLTTREHRDINELCEFLKVQGKTTIVYVNDLLSEREF